MPKVIGIGKQRYDKIIENQCFYIDKTMFIKEWWENQDDVTLITRPRRFGKTLNMNMVKCFFSNAYKDRGDLFEEFHIWEDERYRKLQGTYPVIFLSFAKIKQNTYDGTVKQIKNEIINIYNSFDYIMKSDLYNQNERLQYKSVCVGMDDVTAQEAIANLSNYLSRYYGKNVIILLDEYDTPMQEAYVNGYWKEIITFTRSFFNATFKSNLYLERAIMTGITTAEYSAVRKFAKQTSNGSAKAETMSKESIFSDLNNLVVVTTTSREYENYFGFTEEEVFSALEEYGLSEKKAAVKMWYDGFTFGDKKDIYNPWSIINFLKNKQFKTYWVDSSSNSLIDKLIKTGSPTIKTSMEILVKGGTIEKNLDEQMVFSALDYDETAIWSLLLASGYLKVVSTDVNMDDGLEETYNLAITNGEIRHMFAAMIRNWFSNVAMEKNYFVKALLNGNIKEMNYYMNKVALATFSYFDTGKKPSEISEPERFYHGFSNKI